MSQERFYTDEEAEEILRRAARQEGSGGVDAVRLRMMAAEAGISPEALEKAEREHRSLARRTAELEEYRRTQVRGFMGHLAPYVAVNLFLFITNVVTEPGNWWFIYPLFGWGIGMACHAYSVFFDRPDENDDEFVKWRDRRRQEQALE